MKETCEVACVDDDGDWLYEDEWISDDKWFDDWFYWLIDWLMIDWFL